MTQDAYQACEKRSLLHGQLADGGQAQEFSELFAHDGVFNRLGTEIKGRTALREFLANRPNDVVQQHHGRNFTFELAECCKQVTGTLDFKLELFAPGTDTPQKSDSWALSGSFFADREVLIVDRKYGKGRGQWPTAPIPNNGMGARYPCLKGSHPSK